MKWKCMNRECGKGCIAEVPEGYSTNSDCLLRGSGFTFKPNWLIEGFLPKLTAEVFDREDCPAWAKYAAVSKFGCLTFFEEKPVLGNNSFLPLSENHTTKLYRNALGRWDASDWQNSLIERPEEKTLPDWCKVDNMGWHKRCGYFKVNCIDSVFSRVDIQQVDDKSKGYLSFHTVCNDACQARLRPYNAEEMRGMVGKVVETKNDIAMALGYSGERNKICVATVNNYFSAEALLAVGATIDGKPCGVLEHLENGEWVE